MRTVQQAKKNIQRIEKDRKARIDPLSVRWNEAREKNHTKLMDELKKESDQLEEVYRRALLKANAELNEALSLEHDRARVNEALRQDAENVLKENARREWIANNGNPSGFEVAWPKILERVSEDRVVENMKKQDASKVTGTLIKSM